MRVLLIKTSSMGDILHMLPALTDASHAIPGISFDWVVESSFADIPRWHRSVSEVIPVQLRRWRKHLFSQETRAGLRVLRDQLRHTPYDLVLDAQGLVKSAILTYFASGVRAGLDWRSAREALAAVAYQRRYRVNFYQHAIVRMRLLCSQALGYALPTTSPDFGLSREQFAVGHQKEKYIVFLHGTTWASKQWPEVYWLQLADIVREAGYRIKISGGNDAEVARAYRIAAHHDAVVVLPRLSVSSMAQLLAEAAGAVAVDTGFGHLAGALGIPLVSVYGATTPLYTGAHGTRSVCLSADYACSPCLARKCKFKTPPSAITPPCFTTLPPEKVWEQLKEAIIYF
ncbi:MAG TPA: lipopolysaccharide heptosyltransferase I [Gammaproteobacteria bacterium]|jgi:heptosyltransferase-1|nr:lipopolysaccharide heptosyltransferase I [Gammaproteobacteria bacterium]